MILIPEQTWKNVACGLCDSPVLENNFPHYLTERSRGSISINPELCSLIPTLRGSVTSDMWLNLSESQVLIHIKMEPLKLLPLDGG